MRRPGFTWAVVIAATIVLHAAPTTAKKKDLPLPSPVLSLSRGDADGPMAAAIGTDGRLHIVFVEGVPTADRAESSVRINDVDRVDGADLEDEEAVPTLVHRVRSTDGVWSAAETVTEEIPTLLRLAVGPAGPVIAYVSTTTGLLSRTADGWKNEEIATTEERPLPPILTGSGRNLHALVLLRGDGESPSHIRRIPIGTPLPGARVDIEVPGAAVISFVATGATGRDHVFISRQSPTLQIRTVAGRKMEVAPGISNLFGSLGRQLSPLSALPVRGDISGLAMRTIGREPALLWTSEIDETDAGAGIRHQLHYLTRSLGRFGGPESLLDTREKVSAIDIETKGSLVVVAIISDDRLMVRFRNGVFWEKWAVPPGANRVIDFVPEAIDLVIDDRNRAVIVTRERLEAPVALRRIVEWTVLPSVISP